MEANVIHGVAIGFVIGYLAIYFSNRKGTNRRALLKRREYKFVMVVRTDISLSKTKIIEHSTRAALECYKTGKRKCPEDVKLWEKNSQPKIALKLDTNGNEEIYNFHKKAENLGLVSVLIQDDGSSVQSINYTVIGIGPGPEDLIDKVTGHLKLL